MALYYAFKPLTVNVQSSSNLFLPHIPHSRHPLVLPYLSGCKCSDWPWCRGYQWAKVRTYGVGPWEAIETRFRAFWCTSLCLHYVFMPVSPCSSVLWRQDLGGLRYWDGNLKKMWLCLLTYHQPLSIICSKDCPLVAGCKGPTLQNKTKVTNKYFSPNTIQQQLNNFLIIWHRNTHVFTGSFLS